MNINKRPFSMILMLVLALLIPVAAHARIRNRIIADEIPDMEYNVYFYESYPGNMLAVFDIPDDDFRVFMYHTMYTRRATGRPDHYLEGFRWKIKGFKTAYELRDKRGQVRGYLMASRFLWYQFMSYDDRLGVRVLDDYNVR